MTIGSVIDRLRAAGDHETYPPASAADVARTESAIGVALPESFKRFVTEFSNGAYLFGVQEVARVGRGNRRITAIQEIEREAPAETIPFREGGEAAYEALVPFGLDANGNEWCFVVEPGRPDNEYEVAYLDPAGAKLYGRMRGFTEWLSLLAREQDEVIRTLYDDDVVRGELSLG